MLLGVAACRSGRDPADAGSLDSVTVDGAIRTFHLVVPPRGAASQPLLLVFHGSGSSGRRARALSGLDSIGVHRGYVVAFPDAPIGNWAENCDCSIADRAGVNDTGLVRAIVDTLDARLGIDRARVYAAGFSQGGLFVHRLACEMAGLVNAVASVAAPMSAVLAERCRPERPVGVLVLQGTLDDAFPYEGRAQGTRTLLGARGTAAFWRILNRCTGGIRARTLPDPVPDGTSVMIESAVSCADDVGVTLITVDGGRHEWNPSRDAATGGLLLDFFDLHHRRRGAVRRAPALAAPDSAGHLSMSRHSQKRRPS